MKLSPARRLVIQFYRHYVKQFEKRKKEKKKKELRQTPVKRDLEPSIFSTYYTIRGSEREGDRQTDTDRKTETDRQTVRKTETERVLKLFPAR